MIISKVTNGLGNQLFQYAIAKSLSVINRTPVHLDLRYYKHQYATDTVRNFKLNHFQVNYRVFNSSVPLVWLSKSTKLFPNRTFTPFFKLVKEEYHHYNDQVLDSKALFLYLKGFWQSEKYFSNITDVLRKDLTFKNNTNQDFNYYKQEILNSDNPVSIHVRRGDYVNNPEFSKTFGFVGLDYYLKAIELVKAQFSNFRFFIFSDDKDWIENFFPLSDDDVFVKVTGENSDIADLQLMSLCKQHIIANSSYSWWGAWLNSNSNKMVIAPQNWYKNQPDLNTKDLVPASWIKI